jgi:hypothetical protein
LWKREELGGLNHKILCFTNDITFWGILEKLCHILYFSGSERQKKKKLLCHSKKHWEENNIEEAAI